MLFRSRSKGSIVKQKQGIELVNIQKPIQEVKQIQIQKILQRTSMLLELTDGEFISSRLGSRRIVKKKSTNAKSINLFPSDTIKTKPTLNQPTKTKPIELFIQDTTEQTPAKVALKKAIKKEFEVFARIEGQDISIGKVKTKEKAVKLLSKRLKKTIAASGFIENNNRILSVQELGLTNGEFRSSRLDFGRVVQKKTKRLGTTQETRQIQYFRKTKGGGGNLFGSSKKSSDFF